MVKDKRLKRQVIKRKMIIQWIRLDECAYMPEVLRQYYKDSSYQQLKRIIETQGYNPSYPVRAIWNEKLQKYEIFDGIHRHKICRELGTYSSIPLVDETSFLTRPQAIAQGIMANLSHKEPYSPIDIANNLKSYGESLSKGQRYRFGRPKTVSLAELSSNTGMDEKLISHYINLLRLPDSVQKLVGQGKLATRTATVLLGLIGTPYEHKISELARQAFEKKWVAEKLTAIVQAIKKGGHYEDARLCDRCGRKYLSELDWRPHLCPECAKEEQSGIFRKNVSEKKNLAMKKYLKFRTHAEKVWTDNGLPIPSKFQNQLDRWYEEWQGKPS